MARKTRKKEINNDIFLNPLVNLLKIYNIFLYFISLLWLRKYLRLIFLEYKNLPHIVKITIWFLIYIIFCGIILRGVEVVNKNYLFEFDQGRDYLAAKSIAVDHKMTLIGSEIGAGVAGFKGIFHGPIYFYILSFILSIFNGDPYGGLIIMFAFSIATILMGFILGRLMFGFTGGVLVAALISISHPFISSARFVWNTHPSPFFILVSFYFFYKFLKSKNNLNIFLASFFSGFVYNFQLAIAIPLTISLYVFLAIYVRFSSLRSYLFMLLGSFFAFIPMILFEARHDFQMVRGLHEYIFVHPEMSITSKFVEMLLNDHMNMFFYNLAYTFPISVPGPNWLIYSIFIFSVAIIFFDKKKLSKIFANEFIGDKDFNNTKILFLYFLLLILVTFFVLSFLRNFVFHYYLLHLDVIYIIFASFLILFIFSLRNKRLVYLFGFVFFIFFLYTSHKILRNAYADYFDYGGTHKINGKIEVIDTIYRDAGNSEFGILIFAPPIYTYPYDYLLWWYGNKKYSYTPYKEKKSEVYLLIEPDTSKPWSYNGWLETVIKDGKMEKTINLSSGFIVQKRKF